MVGVQSKQNCLKCKGRLWCGLNYCPILAKSQAMQTAVRNIDSASFSGSAPSVFVGRVGYPDVNVGILSTQEKDSEMYDAPKSWAQKNIPIPDIINFRSSLINSRFTANVKERSRFLSISQEVGMASKPVDLSIDLKEKPKVRLNYVPNAPPMGPNAKLIKVDLNENPKIDKKVDYVVGDVDFKASDAITYLYEKGFDENFLSRLLSIGNLGVRTDRKLVPTRWSITATDDALGKKLIEEVKQYSKGAYQFYYANYLGNHYIILLFPEVWSYELFEMYMPNVGWNVNNTVSFMTDSEGYTGRKEYAEDCAGGYYTVRLAILEKMSAMKRQGSALVLRFVTDDYSTPLGVWVTREAARKVLKTQPIEFDCKETMLAYTKALVKKKWNFDVDALYKNSQLLSSMRNQMKLNAFV